MNVTCAECGGAFTAPTTRRRYCSGRCRSRAFERRSREASEQSVPTGVPPLRDGLVAFYSAEILSTVPGALALTLAGHIDRTPAGTSGYPALMRQYRQVLADLRSIAKPPPATPLALIRARRAVDRSEQP